MKEREIYITIQGTISDEKTQLLVNAIRILQDELRGLDFNLGIRPANKAVKS